MLYLEQVRHMSVDLTYALVLLMKLVQGLQERFVDPRSSDEPFLDDHQETISVVTIQLTCGRVWCVP